MSKAIITSFKEYSVWVETLTDLDEGLWSAPIADDKWSVSEIIDHITNWDSYLLSEVLPTERKEQGIEFPEFEPFNKIASDYAKSGLTKSQILQEAKDTREQLVNELMNMSNEGLKKQLPVNGSTHCPHTGTPYSLLYVIEEFIYHDHHHQKQISQFLRDGSLV